MVNRKHCYKYPDLPLHTLLRILALELAIFLFILVLNITCTLSFLELLPICLNVATFPYPLPLNIMFQDGECSLVAASYSCTLYLFMHNFH